MESAADRFEKSATRWAHEVEKRERVSPIPKGSLDDEALEGFSIDREEDALLHAGVRILAGQRLTQIHLEVWDLQETCESPIELAMALALIAVARHEGVNVKLIARGHEFGDRFEPTTRRRWPDGQWPDLDLRVELQAQLGEHRVDFLLTLDATQRGKREVRSSSKKMIIECDGHDFHERTKQQASRDRERDRNLQSFGFLVFRYTGRDIWSDVFSCASEAIDALAEPVRTDLSLPQD
jgi:very-short-patch-repair endonuclease